MISIEKDQYRLSLILNEFICIFKRNQKNRFGCKHDISEHNSWSQLMHHKVIYKCMPDTTK